MRPRYFYGWNVLAATFVMALFSFGLGFYGLTVYIATLQALHGWSASAVSAPVTVYYVAGALLTTVIGDLYQRFGPRVVVAGGSVAMAGGLAALGVVTQPWQLYPVFLVMSVGWGAMSGAAINIILAPWWERRRGFVVSIAFNGATFGGVIIAPALIPLIGRLGFTRALATVGFVLLVVLLAIAAGVMRRGPEALGLGPDGEPRAIPARRRATHVAVLERVRSLRARPRGAGRRADAPGRDRDADARRGRRRAGGERDDGGGGDRAAGDRRGRRSPEPATRVERDARRADRRPGPAGVGAVGGGGLRRVRTVWPGSRESDDAARPHPRRRVAARALQLARRARGGINQFTFAFGPSLVGVVRDWAGAYGPALTACTVLQAVAALMILLGPGHVRSTG